MPLIEVIFSHFGQRRGESVVHSVVSTRASNEGRRERILQLYYDRLRDLTNFFFAVNALLIGLVVQFAHDDLQQLLLAVLGYSGSVATPCIYKGFLSLRSYREDMRPLEESLDYDISGKYEKRLKGTPVGIVRVALVRLCFSFLFAGFYFAAIIYFFYRLSALYCLTPPWFNLLLGINHLHANLLRSLGHFSTSRQAGSDLGRGANDIVEGGVVHLLIRRNQHGSIP